MKHDLTQDVKGIAKPLEGLKAEVPVYNSFAPIFPLNEDWVLRLALGVFTQKLIWKEPAFYQLGLDNEN